MDPIGEEEQEFLDKASQGQVSDEDIEAEQQRQAEEQDKRKLAAFLIAVDFKNNGETKKVSDDMVEEKLNALAAH